jgi:hypothetical protein
MWGQGLLDYKTKFKDWVALGLQNDLGKTVGITYDGSRSGAGILGSARGRADFVDTYPELFPNGTGLAAFKATGTDGVGRNESPAWGLYGEIPSTYPTITAQVEQLSLAKGRQIDYVLLDGGINDIGPEDIIDPQVHDRTYIENYERPIRDIGYQRVLDLLVRVRQRCPKAVIFYFGFFPGLSYLSNPRNIRDFFQHEYADDFQWYLNQYIHDLTGRWITDVPRLINEAQTRALWFHGRWQYWTRQAVAAANEADARSGGPGVVYVPSGFTEDNAAYAGRPYLWQKYEDPTDDQATAVRLANIPRNNQLNNMRNLVDRLHAAEPGGLFGTPGAQEPTAQAKQLDAAIKGPQALKRQLNDYNAGNYNSARAGLIDELSKEIHRIQHGHIASLGHPNVAGAFHWAGLAMERYKRHRETVDQIAQAPVALDAQLRRYNLRSRRSLAADAGHLEVDSLCVLVTTAQASDQNLAEPVFLVVHTKDPKDGFRDTRYYLLTFRPYQRVKPYRYFEPGAVNRLTVAIDGDLLLTSIDGCSIALGPDPYNDQNPGYGLTWRPETVALEVNGREVVQLTPFGKAFGPGQQLDLGWPGPAPSPTKPVPTGPPPEQQLVRRATPFAKSKITKMEARIKLQRAVDIPPPPPARS